LLIDYGFRAAVGPVSRGSVSSTHSVWMGSASLSWCDGIMSNIS
jgi:hypothetical protein